MTMLDLDIDGPKWPAAVVWIFFAAAMSVAFGVWMGSPWAGVFAFFLRASFQLVPR